MSDFRELPPIVTPRRPVGQLSSEELATLNEEIAGMAKAGLPLDEGLRHLAEEMGGGKLKQLTLDIANDLRAGKTLPEALAHQDKALPPYYSCLVSAGIRTGNLADVLATLTSYARTMAELRSTVITSFIYPSMILCVGMFCLFFWLLFVVPEFEKVMKDFKLRLPFLTQLIFDLSHHVWIIYLPVLVPVAGVVLFRFILCRTEEGRIKWCRMLYAIPCLGTLLRSARLAAFTDLLGILVRNAIPLPEALRLTADATGDPLLRVGTLRALAEVDQGGTLSRSLRKQGDLVPGFVAWMTMLGERQGRLEETLRQTAEFYRKQAESRAALFRSVFPSVLIVVIAIILLAAMFIAMFLPLLSLLDGLSGVFR